MPCFHPLDAFQNPTTRQISFDKKYQGVWSSLKLPCGRCTGCRLAKSREWSVRAMHEASLYFHNCWLTLTLNDDYIKTRPNPFSIQKGQKSEITKFIKRLRNQYGQGIRFLYCAEYGETCFFCNKTEKDCYTKGCAHYHPWRGRPHYHMCLFNHDFENKRFFKTINGCNHYTSDDLDALWTDPDTGLHMGWATISDLTADSAAYTARYSLKKITGDLATQDDPVTSLKHYQRLSPDGEILDLIPEYINMSRGSKKLGTGGIGKGWLDNFSKEVLDNDSVLFKECRIKPPRYYDDKLHLIDPYTVEENKFIRVDKALISPDNTPERLAVREYITQQRTSKLTRKEI